MPKAKLQTVHRIIDNLRTVHADWQRSPDANLPKEFWTLLDNLIIELSQDDVLPQLNPIYSAVNRMIEQRDKSRPPFHAEPDTMQIRNAFWEAFEDLLRARDGDKQETEDRPPKLESIAELNRQNVPIYQIAKMWALPKSTVIGIINGEEEVPADHKPPPVKEWEARKEAAKHQSPADRRRIVAEAEQIEKKRIGEANTGQVEILPIPS